MRRLPREVWWIAALTIVAGIVAWGLGAGREHGSEAQPVDLTTYSSSKGGLRALYLTLEQLHYEVRRTNQPFSGGLPKQGVLVVAQPVVPVTDGEMRALSRWVSQGHTLLLIADSGLTGLLGSSPLLGSFAEIRTTFARPTQPTYLARGVEKLAVKLDANVDMGGGDAKTTSGSPGRRPSPPTDEKEMIPQWPDELGRGVIVFRDKTLPVVTYQKLGKGEVVMLLSSWTLSNDGIGRDDNLAFALNILGPPDRTRPISFDEYHHGYGESPLLNLLPTPTQRVLARFAEVQLSLALLVVMYARSRRLGRVIPLQRDTRQRSEFLSMMTTVLRKGEATHLALRTAREALAGRLTRQLGLPSDAEAQALAQAAGRVNPEAGEKLEEALRQCDAALAPGVGISQSRALSLLRELDEAERLVRQV